MLGTLRFFDDIADDVSDDVVTKGSVRFWTRVTIFLKSWSEIWVVMRKMPEIRLAM